MLREKKRFQNRYHCLLLALFASILAFRGVCATGMSAHSSPALISPVGAVIRSAMLPGWGQIHASQYFSGSFSLLATTSLLAGGLVAHRSYQAVYNDEYMPIATLNPKSVQALSIYSRVNQIYKIRQFFLLATAGVWAYSVVDSYVGANIRNAKNKSHQLARDAATIEKLSIEIEPNKISLEFMF